MRIYWLVFIILLFIFLLKSLVSKETFIVPQNSDVIDETKLDLYLNNLKVINDILNKKYGSYKSEDGFTSIDKINPILTKRIKNYMMDKLQYNIFKELSNFSNFSVDISTPFFDCKYKFTSKTSNSSNSTTPKPISELITSFNTTLSLNNIHQYDKALNFVAYQITVVLKIKSRDPSSSLDLKNMDILKNYKDDYFHLIDFEIVNISINKITDIVVPFKPIDKLYENRYRITNELHLLTPFTSSYDDMIITDKMKQLYEKSIPQLKNIQAPIYKPFIN